MDSIDSSLENIVKLHQLSGILWAVLFRIDVTFGIRTILCGINLLIDNMKTSDRVFISKQDCGEESRIAERESVCVCVRQRIAEKER